MRGDRTWGWVGGVGVGRLIGCYGVYRSTMKINRHRRAKVLTQSEIQLIFSHGLSKWAGYAYALCSVSACLVPVKSVNRPLAKVLFARGGKGFMLKGKGTIQNFFPFPLSLFPTYARSLMLYATNSRYLHTHWLIRDLLRQEHLAWSVQSAIAIQSKQIYA